ncbi:major facilitator superfamily permease [Actinomadura verrucosospora]|uniref:Major facilitator superfamily permease n=1 Tax=Actinomadura verrucosospora TaxID=46165 RepID=A0A7D3W123_ACTVE|nr:major facilitator superfamily permease [Actinomadura verrucosospora]
MTAATLLRVSAEGVATALVLTVQARTGHAATAGYLQTAMTLPYVISGPMIGNALDRLPQPRRLAVPLALAYAAATGLLLTMAGGSPLVLALTVAAVIGCTEPIVVALTGLLPRFVPADRLSRAYGLEASSYNVAAIVGPGLAAGVASFAGGRYAGAAVVACAVAGVCALPLLPFAGPDAEPAPSTREPAPSAHEPAPASAVAAEAGRVAETGKGALAERDIGEVTEDTRSGLGDVILGGLLVLARGRVLRAVTVATTLAWLGFGGVAVTAVLLAQHVGAPASAGGRLLVAMAVGSLLGSLASSRWLTPRHAEPVLVGGLVAFGAALASLAAAPSAGWAMAAFCAAGLAEGPVFAATLMLRQRESPPDRLGQVNTTGGSLKIGASALGAALTAACADAVGPVGIVLAIAGLQFAGAGAGWFLLRPR